MVPNKVYLRYKIDSKSRHMEFLLIWVYIQDWADPYNTILIKRSNPSLCLTWLQGKMKKSIEILDALVLCFYVVKLGLADLLGDFLYAAIMQSIRDLREILFFFFFLFLSSQLRNRCLIMLGQTKTCHDLGWSDRKHEVTKKLLKY